MFNEFVKIIIDLEGGEVLHSHPSDPGGLTKYGISKRAFPNLDIESLTYDQASEIYYKNYYLNIGLQNLTPALALCVFDSAVNQGHGTAIRLLQRSVKAKEDGVLGPDTVKICTYFKHEDELIRTFLTNRAILYTRTGNFAIFGRGWLMRLFKIHEASMLFRS